MWLRMHAWIDKDIAETEALTRLTVLIDPRPFVFWQSGAHTMVFDMPVWRIREAGGEFVMPEGLQKDPKGADRACGRFPSRGRRFASR